jgi:hypothetical protein
MALTKRIELKNNFGELSFFPNCYIKVATVSGNKDSIACCVNFQKNEGGQFLDSQSFTFTPSMTGSNFIAQAYEHLKTLPEFDGATDC